MNSAFPLQALSRPLAPPERESLHSALEGLLLWQRDLRKWPEIAAVPDATPIVSLYAKGALCGCAGVSDGTPQERLARAFVQALGDGRFGGLDRETRHELRAQVSYVKAVTPVEPRRAAQMLEVGSHGIAVASRGRPVTLLPDVARDHSLDAEGMLATLERKGNNTRAEWPADGLYLFETDSVLARPDADPDLISDPIEAAAAWLARRVDAEGRVTFGMNARTGEQHQLSPMFHGRCAILVRALLSQRNARGAAVRARRHLQTELMRALAGQTVEQWPEDPSLVAGTLALGALAGIELSDALQAYARRPEILSVPWHAAQVVAALGKHAPSELWAACQRNLEAEPWAPWTALAAHARDDAETLARATAALIASIPEHGPHVGGVGPGTVPELARTAATVEALMLVDSAEARAACSRARAFLLRHQLNGARYAPTRDPASVHGAFPQTPVHDYLQIDVTGHALLALSATSA